MAIRRVPLVTGWIYHVFNRTIFKQDLFINQADYLRFSWLAYLLQFGRRPFSPSVFFRATDNMQRLMLQSLTQKPRLVQILAFAWMPNHYHMILKQVADKGIQTYLSNLQNAYTRYFNVKNNQKGQLFNPQFKAVVIEDDEQFKHTTRYVILNPHTAYVVKDLEALKVYPWTCLPEFLGQDSPIGVPLTETKPYLEMFESPDRLIKYILDQADYQRQLARIKHLMLEESPNTLPVKSPQSPVGDYGDRAG